MHLDDYNGIDMLGNMMESSVASIDRAYYGDIHNMGHVFMAFSHDPESRHLESFGVLGERSYHIGLFMSFHFMYKFFFCVFKYYSSLWFGLAGESATAIRDPAFYRWHAFIDQYFQIHKEKLRPYNEKEIGYESISVASVEVKSDGNADPNVFNTFWQQSDIDLSRGMDFIPRGNIFARSNELFQH